MLRRGVSRFELLAADAERIASLRMRVARPGRGVRPSWEVDLPGGPSRIVITCDQPSSVIETLRRDLRGEALAVYTTDGWTLAIMPRGVHRLVVQPDRFPADRRVAAVTSVVVTALHQDTAS